MLMRHHYPLIRSIPYYFALDLMAESAASGDKAGSATFNLLHHQAPRHRGQHQTILQQHTIVRQ